MPGWSSCGRNRLKRAADDRVSLSAARRQQRHPAHALGSRGTSASSAGSRLMLTAHPRAYERVSDGPPRRCSARHRRRSARSRLTPHATSRSGPLSRHFSRGRTAGSRGGRALFRAAFNDPAVPPARIWSTYPIATAHAIGRCAAPADAVCRGSPISATRWRRTAIPPIRRRGGASNGSKRRRRCARAAASVFVTPGAARMYRERYPAVRRARSA